MGEVIKFDLYRTQWKEVISTDDCNGGPSTLQAYVDERTGQVEIVQMNDEYEAIRTTLSAADVRQLTEIFSRLNKLHKKA